MTLRNEHDEHARPRRHRHSALPFVCLALLLISMPAGILAGCAPAASSSSPGRVATNPNRELVYVAMAASDGVGVGTSDPSHDSWPVVLSGELGHPAQLVNLSASGTTVAQALKAELPTALHDQPDVVTVWLAVNDMVDGVPLATYSSQLTSLLSQLHKGTHAHIYVANVPDLTLLPAAHSFDATAMRNVIAQWNAAIASICAHSGTTLVDLYGGWKELAQHPEYISADGFHPSSAGSRRLALIFADAVKRGGV